MIDLSTQYMGLTLKNPIIIGSSGLTNSVANIKKLEANGAAAVVLKSIFEEQIMMEAESMRPGYLTHTEAEDYITRYTKTHNLNEYLKLVENAKKEVSIPVIASINCATADEWVSFARSIENSGADGLELNIFVMPGNIKQKGADIEQLYFDIVGAIKEQVSIPLAVKMSFYFSGLANMIFNLSIRNIAAIVLFNRFYRPDIDLKEMKIVSSHVFSTPEENALTLRWIGMMADEVRCDLAATTGIHDGFAVLKNLLAGAKAVQIASCIYQHGPEYIRTMLEQISDWLKERRYGSLEKVVGKLSQDKIQNPILYERSQFMKYFSEAGHTI